MPIDDTSLKTCRKCKIDKPLTDFWASKATPDGRQVYCKPCNRDHFKEWRKANRERIKELRRSYYHRDNPGRKTIQMVRAEKEAKASRTEKACKKCKIIKPITEFVPWSVTADGKTYQCRECIAEYSRNRYKKNPAKEMVRVKNWQARNPDKIRHTGQKRRVRERKVSGSHTLQEWKDLCEHFGNRCVRCGNADALLTKDHIIALTKPGSSDDISNIQPLCYSCNSKKGNRYTRDFRITAEQGVFYPAVSVVYLKSNQ